MKTWTHKPEIKTNVGGGVAWHEDTLWWWGGGRLSSPTNECYKQNNEESQN